MSITKKIIRVFKTVKKFKHLPLSKISEKIGISKSSLHRQKQIIEANSSSVEATQITIPSSMIEGAVDNIINDRQKRNRKMQWTREGVIQIIVNSLLILSSNYFTF